jgi:hypothetical protein
MGDTLNLALEFVSLNFMTPMVNEAAGETQLLFRTAAAVG